MLQAIAALALLVLALVTGWQNRPATRGNGWPGSAAGRFAAALMLLGAAIAGLLAAIGLIDATATGNLILGQLALYAALPLMISCQLAERFGYNWNRQIWGRILLGWCVVFELSRRNDGLDALLMISLVIGLSLPLLAWWKAVPAAAPTLAQQRLLPLLLWFGLLTTQTPFFQQWLNPASGELLPDTALLAIAALTLLLSQPESWRMAQDKHPQVM